MKNYKELGIWRKGIEIVTSTYLITKRFPTEEKYGLISQVNRAAVSIPANIAEGSSRHSDKDYVFSRPVEASSKSDKLVFEQANLFAAKNNDAKAFEAAMKANGTPYAKQTAEAVKKNDYQLEKGD